MLFGDLTPLLCIPLARCEVTDVFQVWTRLGFRHGAVKLLMVSSATIMLQVQSTCRGLKDPAPLGPGIS